MCTRLLPTLVAPGGALSLVVLALAAVTAPRAAIAADPPTLSEKDFVTRFENSDPRIEVLEARLESARADVTAAMVRPNPSIAYDREQTFSSEESFPENYLRLAVPVDLSGRRGRRIEAAETAVQATRAETAAERFLLTIDALALYYDAAYRRLRLETLHAGRVALANLVQIVKKRAKAGDASGYDVQRLELELAAYDDLMATAETDLAVARRRLGMLVGDPDALYDAADPLNLPTLPTSLDAIASGAIADRDDYKAVKLRGEQAEDELAAARRGWVPGLVVTGGLKTSDLGTETAVGYVFGVAVSISLFDRGQADQARAAASKRRAAAEARVLERRIPAIVRSAYDQLSRRIAQARQFSDTQLAKIDDLLRAAEVAYREGERPVFELLDAYRTGRDVRLRYLELRREAKNTEIELWRALGRRP